MPRRTALIPTRWGLHVAPMYDHYVTGSLLLYGEYSPDETRTLEGLVQPGGTVVIVGGHCGALAAPLACRVGPQGRVMAYEPQQFLARCLEATAMVNDWPQLEVRRTAVGAAAGSASMPVVDYERPGNFGGVEVGAGTVTVPVVTLDEDLASLGACDLLVIDAEGFEAEVLKGARRFLRRLRPVVQAEVDREGARDTVRAWCELNDYVGFLDTPMLCTHGNFRQATDAPWPGVASINALCLPREAPGLLSLFVGREAL